MSKSTKMIDEFEDDELYDEEPLPAKKKKKNGSRRRYYHHGKPKNKQGGEAPRQ